MSTQRGSRFIGPRSVAPVAIFLLTLALVAGPALAQQGNLPPPDPACQPHGTAQLRGQTYPTNDLEPGVPAWCYPQPEAGPATRIETEHGWLDSWDNDGPGMQQLVDGSYDYRVFENFISPPGRFQWRGFINSDHWMLDLVDVSPDRLSGGVMVSPDRTFPFVDGTLVVEADAAAGSDAMGGANRFYEIDVSPAAAPTGYQVDALYGYGSFGYVGGLGCRLERNDQGGNFVCSMYDDSGRATDSRCVGSPPPRGMAVRPCNNPDVSGRVWETQGVGNALVGHVEGGYPQYPIPGTNLRLRDVWRQCATNEHDLHCRDRFRMELTRDTLTMFVNGYQAMRLDLAAQNPEGRDSRIPPSWLDAGVRVYLTSWVNGGQHEPIRWHWNEVRVNPGEPPSASPSFCFGVPAPRNTCPHNHTPGQPEVAAVHVTPTPTQEPLPSPTATPEPTVAPTPTPSPTPAPEPPTVSCEVRVRLDGVERDWVPC